MFPPSPSTFIWDCIWQSTLWVALGGLASLHWRHWPARAHRMMVLALLGCLITPLLSLIVRQSGWGFLTRPAPGIGRYFDDESLPGWVWRGSGQQITPMRPLNQESLAGISSSDDSADSVLTAGNPAGPNAGNGVGTTSVSPLEWFVYLWIALTAWVLARMITSVIHEISILREARPITDPKVYQALKQALSKLNLQGTQPAMRVSDRIRCPVIFCWGTQPTLLLPTEWKGSFDLGRGPIRSRQLGSTALQPRPGQIQAEPSPAPGPMEDLVHNTHELKPRDWELDELVGLVSHELAHRKRRDHWAALLGEAVVCLLPWHPLIWWAKRRLEHLAELACDHWVLASGQSAQTYAESLLGLAQQRESMLALPAVKHRSKLKNRISRILSDWPSDPTPGRKWDCAAAMASVSLAAAMALIQAQAAAAVVPPPETRALDASQKDGASPRPSRSSLVIKRLNLPGNVLRSASLDVSQVAISPDGRKAAVIPNENYRDIDITDLENGTTLRVTDRLRLGTTNTFMIDSLLWSRDGRWLAFNYHPGGNDPTNDYISLRLVSAAGDVTREVYRSNSINPQDWSHDSQWILAAVDGKDRSRELILIPIDSGQPPRTLMAGPIGQDQKLSPDGSLIAFQRRTNGQFGVFLHTIADHREVQVGPSDQINMSPHFTRDGRYLLFRSNRSGLFDFWAQPIADGKPAREPVRIKADVGQRTDISQVLNNGQIVSFTWTPGMGVFRVPMNPETGRVTGNPKLVTFGRNGAPSPDGRWVAYNSFDWGTGTDSNLGLRVISIDGKEERSIAPLPMNRFVCQWFPDGNSLLIGGYVGGQRGAYRLDVATGKLETFYRTNAYVSNQRVSPDGRHIAYGVNYEGKTPNRMALYLVEAKEGAQPKLLRHAADESSRDPTWSPDGKTIAFSAESETLPLARLLTISPNGGDPKELLRHEEEVPVEFKSWRRVWFPTWSPNGKFIAYSRFVFPQSGTEKQPAEPKAEIWIAPVLGGTPVHLQELDGYSAFNCHWSADGKELFFTGTDLKAAPTEFWTLENYLPD